MKSIKRDSRTGCEDKRLQMGISSMTSERTLDQTFPRSARLTTPEDFKNVFKNANKLHFKEFTVYILENKRAESRLGLAISKKSAKKAVSRNRIKRIIRDSFRLRRNKLKGWDIVFVSRIAAVQLTKPELEIFTNNVWKRLGS